VEALIALVLSTILVGLVGSLFLAQNRFYANLTARGQVQETARTVLESVTSELRSVPASGVLVAAPREIRVRAPLAIGLVCASGGGEAHLYLPLDGAALTSEDVSGVASRRGDGGWQFHPVGWEDVLGSTGGSSVQECADVGSEIGGPSSDFLRLEGLGAIPPERLMPGMPLMVFGEMEFKLEVSNLHSLYMLHQSRPGGPAFLLAGSLGEDTGFHYRLRGEAGWRTEVTGADRDRIDALRFHVSARSHPGAGRQGGDLRYDLTADLPLVNSR